MFPFFKRKKVHVLHIGKTGGSAIKHALQLHPKTAKYRIKLHRHNTTLVDIKKGESSVFILRDPISRFISGFYSRQRKGQPRYNIEWNDAEKEVFEAFKTPNEMACALLDKSGTRQQIAINGLKSIHHLKHYSVWFQDFEYFHSRIDDILFIGFQESLNPDFKQLLKILGLPDSITLPTDNLSAHKNPEGLDKTIDQHGYAALREWYREDFKFISMCKEIMKEKTNTHVA